MKTAYTKSFSFSAYLMNHTGHLSCDVTDLGEALIHSRKVIFQEKHSIKTIISILKHKSAN